jgi:prepilin-type processing-associated H-X9-DG protein
MSNIRQITTATINWAQDHKGQMPARGSSRYSYNVDTGAIFTNTAPDGDPKARDIVNWIAWERKFDPIDTAFIATVADQNITDSGLTTYLGFKRVDHKTPKDAHKANPVMDSLYRCPSDSIESRNSHADSSHGYYRYSFAANIGYMNPVYTYGGFAKGQRSDGTFTGKYSSIRNPSEKILFIEEDEKVVNDGDFRANPSGWGELDPKRFIDLVASRHESRTRRAVTLYGAREGNEDARGNVGFADGHCEFFGRKDALRRKYSGNPEPDPTGF